MNNPPNRPNRPVSPITPDPWTRLRTLTAARIALGRSGVSLPTNEVLRFGLAHAQARDAVHQPLDVAALQAALVGHGFKPSVVTSRAPDRVSYLRRPDWGRRLAEDSARDLRERRPAKAPRIAFVVSDGLSSRATQNNSLPLLLALAAYIPELRVCPVVIATQARVALGDEIGEILGAELVVVLIGERPGLSSPDSLGVYMTGAPRVGLTDATRNCISNVRPEGLSFAEAARKLAFLIAGARALGCTGVDLKDDSDDRLPDERPPAMLLAVE
jgi:ethanolamine ammonia-lyase small subunit